MSEISTDNALAEITAEQIAATVAQRPKWLRLLYMLLAFLLLGLAILGAILPGLPTTVFVLGSAWAAARGYPPLYHWLLRHWLFGPMIVNWQNGGKVSRKAKWHASWVMLLSALIVLYFVSNIWVPIIAIGCMAIINLWLWLRPEPNAPNNSSTD